MEYESMGKLIQALRKEKGLTQKQLAEMLNITDKAVSKWERDVSFPDIGTLPKLASILDTTAEDLMQLQLKHHNEATDCPVLLESESPPIREHKINPLWEEHKNRSRTLLRQGIPGFLIGFILACAFYIFITYDSFINKAFDFTVIGELLIFCSEFGLIFAGFPFGWRCISKLTDQWALYGNIIIIAFLFVFKLGLSLILGVTAYPISIVYSLIKSQKSLTRMRVSLIIFYALCAAYVIFAIILAAKQV